MHRREIRLEVSRRMRRTLAAEPALWMPTVSASTRVRSACPVAKLFVALLTYLYFVRRGSLRSWKCPPSAG
jgi:hypothetical protein